MRIRMGEPLRQPALTVMVPIILIGLTGTVLALNARSADPLLIYRQQNLSAIRPSTLEHLVSLTRDPRPTLGHTRVQSAICSARGTGELRNPWVCVVRYGRGRPVRYSVTIAPSGQIYGIDPTGQLTVRGCCAGPRAAGQ